MKLTLKQLVASADAAPGNLSALAVLAQNDHIPVKPSYWIGKAIRRADEEMKDYHAKRIELCKKHGKLNDETQNFSFDADGLRAFAAEIEELQATEIELSGIDCIKIDALGDAVVPPGVMAVLDWLIVE